MTDEEDPGPLWIESARAMNGNTPSCIITWGPLQFISPVSAVRDTALDLMACAVYSEFMIELCVRAQIPPEIVSRITTSLLGGRKKRFFGDKTNITLMPAGSSERQEPMVLIRRGSRKGYLTPDQARETALDWMEAAAVTESDTLLGQALGEFPDLVDLDAADRIFERMRELRADRPE